MKAKKVLKTVALPALAAALIAGTLTGCAEQPKPQDTLPAADSVSSVAETVEDVVNDIDDEVVETLDGEGIGIENEEAEEAPLRSGTTFGKIKEDTSPVEDKESPEVEEDAGIADAAEDDALEDIPEEGQPRESASFHIGNKTSNKRPEIPAEENADAEEKDAEEPGEDAGETPVEDAEEESKEEEEPVEPEVAVQNTAKEFFKAFKEGDDEALKELCDEEVAAVLSRDARHAVIVSDIIDMFGGEEMFSDDSLKLLEDFVKDVFTKSITKYSIKNTRISDEKGYVTASITKEGINEEDILSLDVESIINECADAYTEENFDALMEIFEAEGDEALDAAINEGIYPSIFEEWAKQAKELTPTSEDSSVRLTIEKDGDKYIVTSAKTSVSKDTEDAAAPDEEVPVEDKADEGEAESAQEADEAELSADPEE